MLSHPIIVGNAATIIIVFRPTRWLNVSVINGPIAHPAIKIDAIHPPSSSLIFTGESTCLYNINADELHP